jgi:hypothetical protein
VTDPNQAWKNLQKQKAQEAQTRSTAFSGRTGLVDGKIEQAAGKAAEGNAGND